MNESLLTRAEGACEFCTSADELEALDVAPYSDGATEHQVVACATCASQISGREELTPKHWFCLQGSIWSTVSAVQVVSWRMLQRLKAEPWAADLLEQAYLEEETLEWAKSGGVAEEEEDDRTPTVDSLGNVLQDGDSVTLIKDLDVKGTTFVAKRGTLVRGVRLTNNPLHVEGKVNKVQLVLVAAFLKKVG